MKPSLSATGWHKFQTKIKPQEVRAAWIDCVNIGYCQQEVFNFLAQCNNISWLAMDDVKDNSYTENDDLVAGLTKVLSRLNTKLHQVHIYRIKLGRAGSQVFRAFNSPDLRGIALVETELLGTDDIFMSSLHRFPLLSSLDLYMSGLKKEQLLKVLTTLPLSCPCIVHLSIYPTKFTSEETKPLCELKKLITLEINFKTNVDCLTALDDFTQPLELLNLYSDTPVSNVWTHFIEIISSYKKLHYLVFWEGVLKCREENALRAIMANKGGRLVVTPKDKQGTSDFMSKLHELRYKVYETESRERNLKCKEEKEAYTRGVQITKREAEVVKREAEQRYRFESRESKGYHLKYRGESTTKTLWAESEKRPVVNPTERRRKFESRESKGYYMEHKDENTTNTTLAESKERLVENPTEQRCKAESRESKVHNLKHKDENITNSSLTKSEERLVENPTEQRCKAESRESKVHNLKHNEDTTKAPLAASEERLVVNPKATEVMEDNKAQRKELRHRNHKNESNESKFCNLI